MTVQIHHGDCLEVLRGISEQVIDAIVTDPPYGLSFMGKKWDYDMPSVDIWRECLRVLKPGGHLLSFAGTRTQHRMAVNIEDAGFEIRDMIAWVYGSGFPKSLDVRKAIDKAAGAEHLRQFICENPANRPGNSGSGVHGETATTGNGWRKPTRPDKTASATPEAQQWAGWGTALKPALEPITMARKPLAGTVAANVLEHGTGALNVDGCRVGTSKNVPASVSKKAPANCYGKYAEAGETPGVGGHDPNLGRWPANLIHDGSDEVVGLFPVTGPSNASRRGDLADNRNGNYANAGGRRIGGSNSTRGHNDNGGSAARFFYCAKASKKDRDEGCEGLALVTHQSGMGGSMPVDDDGNARDRFKAQSRNHHPTVKPTALMRYLCRLVTPPKGIILDPFTGSGSTGKAAILEGFNFIGIEREAEYVEIANARIEKAQEEMAGMLL